MKKAGQHALGVMQCSSMEFLGAFWELLLVFLTPALMTLLESPVVGQDVTPANDQTLKG